MNQFDQLTDQELAALGDKAYRGTMRLFDSVQSLHSQMATMATWIPEYDEISARAAAAFAAGREQGELSSAVIGEQRNRQSAAEALARGRAYQAQADQDAADLADAIANGLGDA